MAGQLREIKSHIQNISDIKQITKAMYAIAITKVTQMTKRLKEFDRYFLETEEIMESLVEKKDKERLGHPMLDESKAKRAAAFVVNSDRGLCGRFTGDLNKVTLDFISSRDEATLIAGGDKALGYFEKSDVEITKSYPNFYTEPEYKHAKKITNDLLDLFNRQKLGAVWAIYMRYINDLRQEIVVEKILPISFKKSDEKGKEEKKEKEARKKPSRIYEPNLIQVIDKFAPFYLGVRVYKILLESKTSEHAIRRQAMKNATDNANELIESLTLSFNKARQREITREIADIMGGAEALKQS